jgi:hypothetical protein
MKPTKMRMTWMVMAFLAVLLSSCNPTELSEIEKASTFAAQTLTAMPEPTETETPTETVVAATSTATPTTEPTLGPVGPTNFPAGVNPLTGERVADPALLNRRPVFVKVANYPASGRPHAGLSSADLVFEYYIGGGMNRFMAVYYGQDSDKIGPVRSGRLIDPQLVQMYQGILGFYSAYETIYDKILDVLGNRAISGTGNECPALCDDGRNIVISKFGDSAALTELSTQRGVVNQAYPLDGMAFDPSAPAGGAEGMDALVLYNNINRGEWIYDESSGEYLRWIEETNGSDLNMIPLVDANTNEQLGFSNVVILFAYHTEYADTMYDQTFWGNTSGQRAIVFRDGNAYDGTWVVPNNTQPIQLRDQNGETLPLKPGNTWYVILGLNSGVQADAGNWAFTFYYP